MWSLIPYGVISLGSPEPLENSMSIDASPAMTEYTENCTVVPAWTVALSEGDIGWGGGAGLTTNCQTGLLTSQEGAAAQST